MIDDITFIVPIRQGSQRVKGKNLKEFGFSVDGAKHSLLSWKLDQLTKIVEPNSVLVSTDWPQAAAVAQSFGCETHERTPFLAGADAPFDKVIAEVVSRAKSSVVAWAPVTSPFIGPTTMQKMFENYSSLSTDMQEQGLIAVSRVRSYALFAGRPLNFTIGSGHLQTQDITPIEIFDWGLSIRPKQSVLAASYMFSNTPNLFEISALENVDINDELEFKMAQALIPLFLDSEKQA